MLKGEIPQTHAPVQKQKVGPFANTVKTHVHEGCEKDPTDLSCAMTQLLNNFSVFKFRPHWLFTALHRLFSSCGTLPSLVAPQHVGSQFPDQGLNPCALHWEMGSPKLSHHYIHKYIKL